MPAVRTWESANEITRADVLKALTSPIEATDTSLLQDAVGWVVEPDDGLLLACAFKEPGSAENTYIIITIGKVVSVETETDSHMIVFTLQRNPTIGKPKQATTDFKLTLPYNAFWYVILPFFFNHRSDLQVVLGLSNHDLFCCQSNRADLAFQELERSRLLTWDVSSADALYDLIERERATNTGKSDWSKAYNKDSSNWPDWEADEYIREEKLTRTVEAVVATPVPMEMDFQPQEGTTAGGTQLSIDALRSEAIYAEKFMHDSQFCVGMYQLPTTQLEMASEGEDLTHPSLTTCFTRRVKSILPTLVHLQSNRFGFTRRVNCD